MQFIIIMDIEIVTQVSQSIDQHYLTILNDNSVKGVNFYGRNSEYIISGSDCGHVFIWDKTSEQCIWYDKGDDDGTVNVLEPHPHFPIIATSGLEHDVKIWQPISTSPVDFKQLKNVRNLLRGGGRILSSLFIYRS